MGQAIVLLSGTVWIQVLYLGGGFRCFFQPLVELLEPIDNH